MNDQQSQAVLLMPRGCTQQNTFTGRRDPRSAALLPTTARTAQRNSNRRPATVLVMVVAMLTMLFVVGVTFLNSVTFEAKVIESTRDADDRSDVIDRLSREVGSELRRAFVGTDGKPFNSEFTLDLLPAGMAPDGIPDTPSPIGIDLQGEIPGVHPLLASIEPHDTSASTDPLVQTWFFFGASDLELARNETSLQRAVDDGSGAVPGTNLVHVNFALGEANPLFPGFVVTEWDETVEGATQLSDLSSEVPSGPPNAVYRRDADGDGVWDSYEYLLPLDRFPNSVRGKLADRLRASSFDPDVDIDDPDNIYYALRIIPHGAMIDVGHAHWTLLNILPDIFDGEGCVTGAYVASGEEPRLRRRFLLPPQNIPLSHLQSRVIPNCVNGSGGQIPKALYQSFVNGNFSDFQNGSLNARWWPIDTGANGDSIAEISSSMTAPPGWIDWVDPFDLTSQYDHRHLITTVSHDDNLMRMGRAFDVNGLDVGDWLEYILDPTLDPPLSGGAANFAIDDWPQSDPDRTDADVPPLVGRLKVSLPGLAEEILIPEGLPLFEDETTPGTYDGREVDALSDPMLPAETRRRFIETIQDGFLLMLRNVDWNGDGVTDATDIPDGNEQAAALTANLIDFVDSDDTPTVVPIRDGLTGVPTGTDVYGLERQPYITELYYKGVDGTAAIELFNPYDAVIDLTKYELNDTGGGGLTNETLIGTIGPRQFAVFDNGGASFPSGGQTIGSTWTLTSGSSIELVRTDLTPSLVVDRFDVADAGTVNSFGTPTSDHSLQRVTGVTGATGGWQAIVPIAEEVIGHTMNGGGADNDVSTILQDRIRPVQIDFANTGSMRTAFPTTGSLLLLARYTNTAATPFNRSLFGSGLPSDDEQPIDDGHMPIFDYDPSQLAIDPDATTNATDPLRLFLPWGQLVFDYFTALPLDHQYDPNAAMPEDWIPTVDLGGVRVHGRIDINSAPWSVLAGLPLIPMGAIPSPFRATIEDTLFGGLSPDATTAQPIGASLAQSIVAYREARQIKDPADNSLKTEDFADPIVRLRTGTGFLTVGELANVREPFGEPSASSNATFYNIDSGAINDSMAANQDYVRAAAVLIALGDWVTTRSHVFTVYGTLRGAGQKSAVDQNAIRFQETVDRLPTMFGRTLPVRIGRRVVGHYAQPTNN